MPAFPSPSAGSDQREGGGPAAVWSVSFSLDLLWLREAGLQGEEGRGKTLGHLRERGREKERAKREGKKVRGEWGKREKMDNNYTLSLSLFLSTRRSLPPSFSILFLFTFVPVHSLLVQFFPHLIDLLCYLLIILLLQNKPHPLIKKTTPTTQDSPYCWRSQISSSQLWRHIGIY